MAISGKLRRVVPPLPLVPSPRVGLTARGRDLYILAAPSRRSVTVHSSLVVTTRSRLVIGLRRPPCAPQTQQGIICLMCLKGAENANRFNGLEGGKSQARPQA